MSAENTLDSEHRKELISKTYILEKLLRELKEKYTLQSLEAARKELHRLAEASNLYLFTEAGNLCRRYEFDVIEKIKNFNLYQPLESWWSELDLFIADLKTIFSLPPKQVKDSKENGRAVQKEKKRTVVIVDDDEDILVLLRHEFKGIGFDVVTFQTGGEALAFLLNPENLKDVFLLVLDRILPDMDGLDILNQFLKESKVHVPVLVLSVLSSEGDISAGLQAGAIDYIPKPFSVFMLMQKALNLLRLEER